MDYFVYMTKRINKRSQMTKKQKETGREIWRGNCTTDVTACKWNLMILADILHNMFTFQHLRRTRHPKK